MARRVRVDLALMPTIFALFIPFIAASCFSPGVFRSCFNGLRVHGYQRDAHAERRARPAALHDEKVGRSRRFDGAIASPNLLEQLCVLSHPLSRSLQGKRDKTRLSLLNDSFFGSFSAQQAARRGWRANRLFFGGFPRVLLGVREGEQFVAFSAAVFGPLPCS